MPLNTGEASQEPEIALDEAASRRALDAIRRDALDGLLALPRVGMGVGGFLAGVRRANRLQVLNHIEIPCLHALGPGFLLTSEEMENALKVAAKAEPLEVLGMYTSKTRGTLEPGAADLETFAALCPGKGQILLMIRPSTVEPVRATLFTREPDGQVDSRFHVRMDGAGAVEEAPAPLCAPAPPPNIALQAVKLAVPDEMQTSVADESVAGDAKGSGEPVTATPIAVTPAKAESSRDANPAAHALISAALPQLANQPETRSSLPPRPHTSLFREDKQWESPRRALLYTCGALALIAAAAFAALDILAPKSELMLNVGEENGALVFRWNRSATAGADRGRLLVNDAGEIHEFPLDAVRIETGFFQYRRKSDRIIARLVLGDRSARAVFFGNSRAPGSSNSGSRPNSGKSGESHTN